jgi:hypothetical protein
MKSLSIITIAMLGAQISYGQVDTTIKTSDLKSVKVSAIKKKPITIVNDKYTSGLFLNMVTSKTYDLINNPPPPGISISIIDYCTSLVFNINVRKTMDGYEVTSTRHAGSISDKGVSPVKLYLDEQEVASSTFNFIHPDDVALVKYFPPGQSQIASGGVLAIYTKKADDLNASNNLNLKKGELEKMYNSINKDTSKKH